MVPHSLTAGKAGGRNEAGFSCFHNTLKDHAKGEWPSQSRHVDVATCCYGWEPKISDRMTRESPQNWLQWARTCASNRRLSICCLFVRSYAPMSSLVVLWLLHAHTYTASSGIPFLLFDLFQTFITTRINQYVCNTAQGPFLFSSFFFTVHRYPHFCGSFYATLHFSHNYTVTDISSSLRSVRVFGLWLLLFFDSALDAQNNLTSYFLLMGQGPFSRKAVCSFFFFLRSQYCQSRYVAELVASCGPISPSP